MQKILLILLCFLTAILSAVAQNTRLQNGMTLKKSVTIDSSHFRFNAKKKSKPVLTIQGKDIIIDFKGSILEGSNGIDSPDYFYGTAISIKKGKNITIKNLKIRGYKTAIQAKNIDGLKFENCDFSYNYRRPVEEYRKFITAHSITGNNIHSLLVNSIDLEGCKNIEVSDCRARANENVLSMKNCMNALVVNNDFSFNSGAAVVLSNSNNNQFLYNRFNFNVADTLFSTSASIVIVGNSYSNIIYKNSITHSSNGIILGEHIFRKNTVSGLPDIIMENDLSYQVFSGVKTYHSNAVINKNRIYHTNQGNSIFSPQDQVISNNQFRYNQTAISITGNGSSTIHHNIFFEDQTALQLSSYSVSEINKYKGLKAVVVANSFNRNRIVYDLYRVDSIAEFNNLYQQYDTLFKADTSLMNVEVEENEDVLVRLSEDLVPPIKIIAEPANPFKGNGRFGGMKSLIPTRWGPYDFSYPYARIVGSDSASVEIDIYGPEGEWSINEINGFEVVSNSGTEIPGKLILKRTGKANGVLKLEFLGADLLGSKRENVFKAGKLVFSPEGL